jgi:Ni/Fe-hydrogenase 1 B-type cytochrome subunit
MEHIATHNRQLIFTPAIRIFHWLRALSILVLVITGFYISWPFLVEPAARMYWCKVGSALLISFSDLC